MTTTRRRGRRAGAVVAVLSAVLGAGLLPAATAVAAVPAAPGALTPDDASSAQYKNLELRWSAVAGATSYRVEISDDGAFDTGTLREEVVLNRWTPPVSLPRGDYAWRVRAVAGTTLGSWSAVGYLTRGWAAAPASPRTIPAGPVPALAWDPLPDASFYEVEFSRVPFGAGAAGYEGTREHGTCFTTHTYLAPYGVVAGAENPPGNEGSCSFDVVTEPAEPEPAFDGTFHVGETYYWRVRGRDGTVDTRKSAFADPALSCTGVWLESGVEVDPDNGVRVPVGGEPPAYAPVPECSQWRDGGSFRVSTDPWAPGRPAAPTGLAVEPTAGDPQADVVAVTDTPLFRWSRVPGASKYRVYLSRTTDFRDADHVWETHGLSLLPVGTLPDRRLKTYWTVQACTENTYCSDPAPMKAFTKVTRVTTAPLAATLDTRSVVLRWATQQDAAVGGQSVPRAPQAKAYQVQVAKDARWPAGSTDPKTQRDVTVDRVADRTDASTSRLTLATAGLVDGLYSWRVRPVDEAGQSLPWGANGSFRLDRAAPTVRIATAAGFAPTAGVLLRFSEPVTGVDATTLGVAVGSSKVVGRLTAQDPTTWLFTPERPWVVGQYYAPWVGAAVRDDAGKSAVVTGGTVRASTVADSASAALVKTAGDWSWSTVTASDAVGRSFVRTSDNPATSKRAAASATVRGKVITLYGCRSPRSGLAHVVVDGRTVVTLDLYQSYSGCGRLWTSATLTDGQHSVAVVTAGRKRAASSGYYVSVDAVRVS